MRNVARVMTMCAALATANTDAQAVTLRDAPSCTEFLQDFNANNVWDVSNKNWLLGFLSGMAFYSDRDILKDVTNSSIYHAVYIYCKENQHVTIDAAAESLYQELEKKKGFK